MREGSRTQPTGTGDKALETAHVCWLGSGSRHGAPAPGAGGIVKSQLCGSSACSHLYTGLPIPAGPKHAPQALRTPWVPPVTHRPRWGLAGSWPRHPRDPLGSCAVARPPAATRANTLREAVHDARRASEMGAPSPARHKPQQKARCGLSLREQRSHLKCHLKTIQFGAILRNTSLRFEKHCAAESARTIGRRL